ncbi:FAD dependent oxidoreductase [Hypoxylon crocopeplum]|nr:FAD dependent oxidoreductase [Hypoxylon crocopeplum]
MASARPSYIIVGAGVFRTSTALHLIAKYPDASVTLIDRNAPDDPSRVAASWDWNKVVRADYRNPLYCRLALEAQDVWRQDPLWRRFYHESGIYWISRTGFAKEVIDNYTKLGRSTAGLYSLPVEEARRQYGGIFDEADYTGVENVLVNKTSGWADAKGALRAVTEKAIELGVKFVTAEVASLEFDDDGNCIGVRTSDGETHKAAHIILSSGAFTPKLLDGVAQATGKDAFRAGDRMIAAGVTTGLAQLEGDTAKEFSEMPVCIQEIPPERGASNGSLPLNEDNMLKWWGQYIFKNTQAMPSGQQISAPPAFTDYAQWKVPDALLKDVEFANKATFGKRGEAWEIKQHRICWDAVTPSEDFIISPHAACKGLYIATCGSFHGWKFFPIIGGYVVRMLDGTLEPELQSRWAWDREIPDVSRNKVWPVKELRDL